MVMLNYSDPQWLTKAMTVAGISATQLAAKSGVSKAQIERLRHDATKTRISTARTLADCLSHTPNSSRRSAA